MVECRSIGSPVFAEGTAVIGAVASRCVERMVLISATICARSRSNSLSLATSLEILACICVIEKIGMHQNNNPECSDLTHRSLIAIGLARPWKRVANPYKILYSHHNDGVQAGRVPRQCARGFARVSGGGPA